MPKRLSDEQRGPLGARLFARRNALGLEQKDVAAHVGISLGGYRSWETGKVAQPNPHHLAKAAEILEVSPAYLQTGQHPIDELTLERLSDQIEYLQSVIADALADREPPG